MKTIFSYFSGMFENTAPAKIIKKKKLVPRISVRMDTLMLSNTLMLPQSLLILLLQA